MSVDREKNRQTAELHLVKKVNLGPCLDKAVHSHDGHVRLALGVVH